MLRFGNVTVLPKYIVGFRMCDKGRQTDILLSSKSGHSHVTCNMSLEDALSVFNDNDTTGLIGGLGAEQA